MAVQYPDALWASHAIVPPPRGEVSLPVSGRLNAWQRRKQLKIYFIRCLYVVEIVSPSGRWFCIIRLQRINQKQKGKQIQQTNKQTNKRSMPFPL